MQALLRSSCSFEKVFLSGALQRLKVAQSLAGRGATCSRQLPLDLEGFRCVENVSNWVPDVFLCHIPLDYCIIGFHFLSSWCKCLALQVSIIVFTLIFIIIDHLKISISATNLFINISWLSENERAELIRVLSFILFFQFALEIILI